MKYKQRKLKIIGKVGRRKKIIPPLKKGELTKHGYKFSKPTYVRRRALIKSVKEDGYITTIGRLIALKVLFKRTSPTKSKIADLDRKWLVKKYGGN